MPIVGTFTELVIFFDKDFSVHSKTIEKTPDEASNFASLKILFFSISVFPLNLNFPFSNSLISSGFSNRRDFRNRYDLNHRDFRNPSHQRFHWRISNSS